MRKSISLLGLGLLVLFLISTMQVGAYNGSLGAQYVCYCKDQKWAGPIYGVFEGHGTPIGDNLDPCAYWATIY
jgi:hypothetical protein